MTNKYKVGDKVMYFSRSITTAGEIIKSSKVMITVQDMHDDNIRNTIAMHDTGVAKYGTLKIYDEKVYNRIVELEKKAFDIQDEIEDLISS